jgi:hypothetical protein
MKLKVTIKNQILVLKWSLIMLAIYLIFVIFKNNIVGTIAMLAFFLVWFIPEAILHVKYYLTNSGRIYTITKDSITIEKNGETTVIPKSEIKGIKLKKPANLQDGWDVHIVGITCYYYLKVSTNNNGYFYLTNLLDPHIDTILAEQGYDFYREKGFGWI